MKNKFKKSIEILIADDDAEDRMLIRDAFIESRVTNNLQFVEDGEQLMDYLYNSGSFSDKEKHPRPGFILLDLNMPRKDGCEALKIIKSDKHLRSIPIVVLTTSKAEKDIMKTYDLGVSSFITKPIRFEGLVEIMKTLNKYWLEIVELPNI